MTNGGELGKNQIYINANGIVTVELHGKQTAVSIRTVSAILKQHTEKIRESDQPVYTLLNLSGMNPGDTNKTSRFEIRKIIPTIDADSIAIVGKPQMLTVTSLIIRVVHPKVPIKMFRSVKSAESWFSNKRPTRTRLDKKVVYSGILLSAAIVGLLLWMFSLRASWDQVLITDFAIVAALLFAIIIIVQLRIQRQALQVTDIATKDLEHERNIISRLHKKDEAIISSIAEGMIVTNNQGQIELINPAATKMLGWTADELVGKDSIVAINATNKDGEKIIYSDRPRAITLKKRRNVTSVEYYQKRNGTTFPVRVTTSPIIIGGHVTGVIEVFSDITHELALDKAKGDFVSLASHQLRTPLSAVNWYGEMLLDGSAGELIPEQRPYIEEVFKSNTRMIELVDSLLDVSRIELGRMRQKIEPVSIPDIIEELEKEMMTEIKLKKIKIKKTFDTKLPRINFDQKMMRMVVENYFSNAVKYIESDGDVKIILKRANYSDKKKARIQDQDRYILFSIQDNGYGIPQKDQKHMFEKLYRGDNVQKLDVDGTGLGLYIVRQIIESMGGRVGFISKEGSGSTFYALIPLKIKKLKQQL